MKKILGALIALFSAAAFAATTLPVQLINPTGSTSGQAIVSTGASSAPGWGTPTPTSAYTVPVTITSSATSGNTLSIVANSNSSSGAAIFLSGNGGATPNKYFRVIGGNWQIVNSGGTTAIVSGDDTGDVTFQGGLTTSQTGGIVGTTTNNNANAGSVGEFASNATTGTSLTTATAANATSTPLTAGDWDVQCTATFVPAGSTTMSTLSVGVSMTSATLPAANTGASSALSLTFTPGASQILSTPVVRESIASSGTAFCVSFASFGISTMTVNGSIRARRVR